MTGYCIFSMEVSTQEPIIEIKHKIKHLLGIPFDSQILTICDCELIDSLDLEDYPLVSDGTKIHPSTTKQTPPPPPIIQPPPATKMKITVKLSARKIQIDVDETDTVRSLKEKILIVEGRRCGG
ncbi:hypothetical protein MIMGU_mgv1a017845mg [Erythranthe guttata]|uniref:Ubiquitin-like domain-containing protein n=1 Tax=Erythranthe guttata TaxID=4155 RepID=A0A022QW41_ERYGU|nr:PREDICTED: uncharacterized protein LOC105964889 [Erythranthe guttata]EYU30745.1 hypothetical protein MIMGU_mgv1a017845mg [Erythranthe guttata]|eukprot:XP_012844853.1 PREDICTED: uncharacterized protein LOC105964889 [Erythranthe guttata]